MLCKQPYMAGSMPYGCGQCLPCRINRGRQWQWRQFLESTQHEHSCFVTLTYDNKHISGNWALDPRHLQLFLKRLRSSLYPTPIRYFACGEYGDTSRRPHYHLSLFGVSGYNLVNGKPVATKAYPRGIETVVSGHIHESWGCGRVDVQEFNHVTAAYVAGYTTKKLRDLKNGFEWNYPEYARQSNRPGLGVSAMVHLANIILNTYQNWESGDVPSVLSIGNRRIPLGRYLLHHLRQNVGFTHEYIALVKQRITYNKTIELQTLFNAAEANTFKGAYLKDVEGRMNQVEAKARRMAIANLSRRGRL
ncbi:replication initiator protein [robinz microvirus RP_48]|nr:replication initiator protein [robinz microvirus RP_48]